MRQNAEKAKSLGDGRPDARRVLGGTGEESGSVEDDESRQEEFQKLVEENRKLREAFELLQRRQASFEGSATPGPQRQVPTTPFTAMLGRMNGLEVTDTPPSPRSQRQHSGGAASECIDGGVVSGRS